MGKKSEDNYYGRDRRMKRHTVEPQTYIETFREFASNEFRIKIGYSFLPCRRVSSCTEPAECGN